MATVSKVEPLVDALRSRILAREFVGGRLPSFRQLGTEYNTTQETMNKVMQALQAEGVLISQGTKGVFVKPPRMRVPGLVASFYDDILKSYPEPFGEFLEKPQIIKADTALAQKMNLPKGTKILQRKRKQGADGIPFRFVEESFSMNYINDEMLEEIHNNPHYNIMLAIKDIFQVNMKRTHEELIARLPNKEEQQRLHIVRSNPVIDTEMTHYLDDDKTIIAYNRKVLNANLFLFTYDYSVEKMI